MSAATLFGVASIGAAAVYFGGQRALRSIVLQGYPRTDFTTYKTLSDSEMRKDLSGKQAWIIGGTKGIGSVLAVELARLGVNVTITGRSDVDHVMEKIKAAGPEGTHSFLPADLSSISNCKKLVKEFKEGHRTLDYLFLTAGFMAASKRVDSPDGVEIDYAISYLARYVILNDLKPWLNQMPDGSVKVFVWGGPGKTSVSLKTKFDWSATSDPTKYTYFQTHWNGHVSNEALVHANSKEKAFSIYGMYPGLVPAENYRDPNGMTGPFAFLIRSLANWIGTSPQEYIQTVLKIVTSPEVGANSGLIFDPYGTPILPNDDAVQNTKIIMEYSQSLINTKK